MQCVPSFTLYRSLIILIYGTLEMNEVSDILQSALRDLDAGVARLEKVLEQKIQKSHQAQQDLFSAQSLQNKDAANTNETEDEADNIDSEAIVRRLDKAIERVEQLLREG